MSSKNDLLGQHIVITGGGRGIGAAIAERVSQLGATTTLLGREEATLQAQAERLDNVSYRVLDVTDAKSVTTVFEAIGDVQVLVNNAGSAPSAPFPKLSQELWRQTMAVNLDGVFYCSQAVIGGMVKANYGRIINIASTSALKGYAYVAAYCAAKHGTLGLTRALATEYARKNITANAICPGFTETDLLTTAVDNIVSTTGRSVEEARSALYSGNPQQRFIEPKEIASTVEWLLREESSSITGQAIAVCGGEVM